MLSVERDLSEEICKGGLLLSGGAFPAAGSSSTGVAWRGTPVLSGVRVLCDTGVTARSGNLPGTFAVPFRPPRDRGGKLPSLPVEASWPWLSPVSLRTLGNACCGPVERDVDDSVSESSRGSCIREFDAWGRASEVGPAS